MSKTESTTPAKAYADCYETVIDGLRRAGDGYAHWALGWIEGDINSSHLRPAVTLARVRAVVDAAKAYRAEVSARLESKS